MFSIERKINGDCKILGLNNWKDGGYYLPRWERLGEESMENYHELVRNGLSLMSSRQCDNWISRGRFGLRYKVGSYLFRDGI